MGDFSPLGAAAFSAGVGALGSIAGSVSGGLFSANQARKNRKFQERMYNQQVQDTLDFWNKQNEYNLPSAQRQRLEDAGLNPLLMYGEGGVSGNLAQQPQLPSAPHGAQAQAGSFNTRLDLANIALVEAQANALNAQANNQNAQAESQQSYKKQLDFYNGINDDTRAIQIAIKYRDYDYLNQRIDALRNDIFQSSQINAAQMAYLSTMSGLSAMHYHLDAYVRGQEVLQGWKSLEIGQLSANAAWKSASAQMIRAINDANITPYQIGVLKQNALRLKLGNDFLDRTLNSRVTGVDLQNKVLTRKASNLSWQDLLIQSNIDKNQSQIFLNRINADKISTETDRLNNQILYDPVNMLLPFGR